MQEWLTVAAVYTYARAVVCCFGMTERLLRLGRPTRNIRLREGQPGPTHYSACYQHSVSRPHAAAEAHLLCVVVLRMCGACGQLMPSDLKFDPGRESLPMFVSEEENVRIEAGSEVRVKIIGIRLAAEQIVVIGTIKEDFLG